MLPECFHTHSVKLELAERVTEELATDHVSAMFFERYEVEDQDEVQDLAEGEAVEQGLADRVITVPEEAEEKNKSRHAVNKCANEVFQHNVSVKIEEDEQEDKHHTADEG